MNIIITNRARTNIDNIYNYIARDSITYANKTINNIYSIIQELKFFPYLGRYVPEISNKYYRERIYKNYRIIYRISENSNTIYILFLYHVKQDFKSFYNLF